MAWTRWVCPSSASSTPHEAATEPDPGSSRKGGRVDRAGAEDESVTDTGGHGALLREGQMGVDEALVDAVDRRSAGGGSEVLAGGHGQPPFRILAVALAQAAQAQSSPQTPSNAPFGPGAASLPLRKKVSWMIS
jgi:hypothetical protein